MTETQERTETYTRKLLIGRTKTGGDVELEIRIENGELSICGNVWNRSHTDIVSGGQNQDSIGGECDKLFISEFLLSRILRVWERWHLNKMRAGCSHQYAAGWERKPIDPSKPLDSYGKHFEGQKQDSWNMLVWVRRDEHPEGLLAFPCPTCGYKYGTAWLKEPLPPELMDEIRSWSVDTVPPRLPLLSDKVEISLSLGIPARKEDGSKNWRARLTYNGLARTFTYFTGSAIRERPTAKDILRCVFQDASYIEEEGERADAKTIREVDANTQKLRDLLGVDFGRIKKEMEG
jgi:hypothetical protein